MDIKNQIAVMQHYANGGKVECKRLKVSQDTFQGCLNPSWSWTDFDYRIKKEPRKFNIGKYDLGFGTSYYVIEDISRIPLVNGVNPNEILTVTEDV